MVKLLTLPFMYSLINIIIINVGNAKINDIRIFIAALQGKPAKIILIFEGLSNIKIIADKKNIVDVKSDIK